MLKVVNSQAGSPRGEGVGDRVMERDDQTPFCTRIRRSGEREHTNNLVGGDLSVTAHGERLNSR